MSRLDSAIRRLEAQRACLDHAAGLVDGLPGPVFELGLGNGRTYDHLRERLPERAIFVFDRQVAAHPDCVPPAERLRLGDFRETVPAARDRFTGAVALIHADIGSGETAASRALASLLAPHLAALLTGGGVLVADQPMAAPGLVALPAPAGMAPGRYFLYRRT
ncbi:MAG: class I SAM-dependent methyltransferase [Alphaproteobacteria bacterium]